MNLNISFVWPSKQIQGTYLKKWKVHSSFYKSCPESANSSPDGFGSHQKEIPETLDILSLKPNSVNAEGRLKLVTFDNYFTKC